MIYNLKINSTFIVDYCLLRKADLNIINLLIKDNNLLNKNLPENDNDNTIDTSSDTMNNSNDEENDNSDKHNLFIREMSKSI